MTAVDVSDAATEATPEFEALAARQERRRGLFMALPAWIYLFLFFAIPFLIVVLYSFATRTRTGGTALSGWNLASYERLGEQIVRDVLVRSVGLALLAAAASPRTGRPPQSRTVHLSPDLKKSLALRVWVTQGETAAPPRRRGDADGAGRGASARRARRAQRKIGDGRRGDLGHGGLGARRVGARRA